ncbi:hypothetical protein SAMN05216227_10663 [Pseudorhodobacter antarcticus]|uniref:SPOR domain-containing protein n=1 Tax=Pseudorhodobacter antarcticus TaxID=1077947 RepID=A0A1H8N026_9RHOB|nr:hypothetical protein [Pseudorhodobacter antarcticus]SEO22866.1 hypothetical protein SAMN05216227_10663 [Pseudorhodobacter antarcticus]
MKRIGISLVICLLWLTGGKAQASNCSVDEYDHNGSTMEVQMCDNELYISYSRPKASLSKIGVRSGTMLFEGTISNIGAVSGVAYRFSADCGDIAYNVDGAIRPNSILLSGQAPVRNKKCQITKKGYDELLFTMQSYREKVAEGDWYAIAGSFRDRNSADQLVRKFPRDWTVVNTSICPKFTRGYWLVAVGPLSEQDAKTSASNVRGMEAYAKRCN